MAFEQFEPRELGGSDEPRVSIRKSGSFGFNGPLVEEYIGEDKEGAAVFYDEDENRVGFKFFDEKGDDMYTVTYAETGATVTSLALINRYNINTDVTTRYDFEWDEDEEMVIIDLDEPVGTYGSPDPEPEA